MRFHVIPDHSPLLILTRRRDVMSDLINALALALL